MSVGGPVALAAIEEALRDIRREEVDVTRRLSRGAERVVRLHESESELIRQLAARRPTQADAGWESELEAATRSARDALHAHAGQVAAVENEVSVLDDTIDELAERRAQLVAEVGRLQGELDAVAGRIADDLASDAAYQSKRLAAADAARLARASIAKTNQADLDREAKGRPYRDDPLFRYLWERGFATRNYRANPLATWLDGLVARLIGYDLARANFVMINELPLRLRGFAEQQAERAADAQAALDAHFDAAIDAAGGKPIRTQLGEAYGEIAGLDAAMVAAEDNRDECTKLQRDLCEGNDAAFGTALTTLSRLLAATPVATASAGRAQDALAAQIESMRHRAGEEERDAMDLRNRLRTLAARRRELEDLQYEFKKAHFDDPRSVFRDDSLTGDQLTEFLRGGIGAGPYWERWQGAQFWTTTGGAGAMPWRGVGSTPAEADIKRETEAHGHGGPAGPFTRPRGRPARAAAGRARAGA